MRSEPVSIAGKRIVVKERTIGELRRLVGEILPETGGNLSKLTPEQFKELDLNDLFGKHLPAIFPELSAEDWDEAYPSEVETLVEVFVNVHFLGLKRLLGPLLGPLLMIVQAGMREQISVADGMTQTP